MNQLCSQSKWTGPQSYQSFGTSNVRPCNFTYRATKFGKVIRPWKRPVFTVEYFPATHFSVTPAYSHIMWQRTTILNIFKGDRTRGVTLYGVHKRMLTRDMFAVANFAVQKLGNPSATHLLLSRFPIWIWKTLLKKLPFDTRSSLVHSFDNT